MAPIYPQYTYSVPGTMAGLVQPGRRVVVPLGGGHANGVVTAVSQAPPPGDFRCKPIMSAVEDAPLLDPPRIALARWMSRHYFAPLGECLRLFLPPGSQVATDFQHFLTVAGAERAAGNGPAFDDRVLSLVAARPGISGADLRRAMQTKALDGSLDRLARGGFIRKEGRVLGSRTKFRTRVMVELADVEVDTARFPVRQKAVLDFLRTHENPVYSGRLLEETGAVNQVLDALEKRKLIRCVREEVSRDPLASYTKMELEVLSLTAHQRSAVDRITADIGAGDPGKYLLLGVTGSGKTQVYIECIHEALRKGRRALMLVPEISLTPALARRFVSHFGDRLALLHSMLSDGERHDQWHRIKRGEAAVVVGTRSALFSPLDDPGIIVLDEEHDASYKQGETPRYHARDTAATWAEANGAVLVLGSATPSVETFYEALKSGKSGEVKGAARGGEPANPLSGISLLELPDRILNRPMPRVHVVDLAREFEKHGKNVIVAGEVHAAMRERLDAGDQVMVLLNRRGFSPVLLCRKCGGTLQCAHCHISMTYHAAENRMLCHYCGYVQQPAERCPECGSGFLFHVGAGTEKLEEIFRRHFPGRAVARFDRDTTRKKGSMKEILDRFDRREIDLLVGTQMIAKGHDFPGVTLVVVLSTDIALRIPDFRSSERTFQLLTQVAGRSGRGGSPGVVYIQTYYTGHYAVQSARAQDYRAFYEREIYFRRQLFYPPFSRLVLVEVADDKEEGAERLARQAGALLREVVRGRGLSERFRILGPAPALLEKIQDKYRWTILVRCLSSEGLHGLLEEFRSRAGKAKMPVRRVSIDVDPVNTA